MIAMLDAHRYCTNVNIRITPIGYQIELYVSHETVIGKITAIIIPMYGITVKTEAINPNKKGYGMPIIHRSSPFSIPTIS